MTGLTLAEKLFDTHLAHGSLERFARHAAPPGVGGAVNQIRETLG